MNGESLNIRKLQLEKLRELFPEAVTDGKIDWEKLQATLGKENIEFMNERYVLNWAGKSDAFKILQQSTTATLKPIPEESYLTPNPSPAGEGSLSFIDSPIENVFIEGENLEVLKVLQKSYYGKVKVICIDPPYNTGNDSFIYPDSFKESKEDYKKRIGDVDEEGYLMKEGMFRRNSKDSGHYHSNWLSMMYPRLFLAKNLLRDDGVIFVHIGDEELSNSILMCNEIFGEENKIGLVTRIQKRGGNKGNYFNPVNDYILVYSKNVNCLAFFTTDVDESIYNKIEMEGKRRGEKYAEVILYMPNLDYRPNQRFFVTAPDGSKIIPPEGKSFRWSPDRFFQEQENGNVLFKPTKNSLLIDEKGNQAKWIVYQKRFHKDTLEKESARPNNLFEDFQNLNGSKDIAEIEIPFDYPKPVSLIKHCFKISKTRNEDIVLDFFSGSATTAQAVLELNQEDGGNRKFILVQLPEKCEEESEAYKAGYKTIADIGKERIRRVIKKLRIENDELRMKEEGRLPLDNSQLSTVNSQLDLGFKVFKLSPSNFKIWRGDVITEENLEAQLNAFTNPVKEGSEKENMLYELMLKAGYLLTDRVEYKRKYYSVNDGELIIALEDINQELIDKITSAKPKKVITLDKLFTGNDQLKTNTVLQMRDAEIDFRTV